MEQKRLKFYETKTFRMMLAAVLAIILLSNNALEQASYLIAGESQAPVTEVETTVEEPEEEPAEEPADEPEDEPKEEPEEKPEAPSAPTGDAGQSGDQGSGTDASTPGETGAVGAPATGDAAGMQTTVVEQIVALDQTQGQDVPANLAEDASFSSGYAYVLTSASLYNKREDDDKRIDLIDLGEGDVVSVLSMAEETVDGDTVRWAQATVIDENDKQVTGWIMAEDLIRMTEEEKTDAFNAESSDYVKRDGNGVPYVSAEANEPEETEAPEATEQPEVAPLTEEEIAALGITAEEAAALTAEQILAYRAQLAEQNEQPEVAPLTEEEIAALGITAEDAAALTAEQILAYRPQLAEQTEVAPLTEEEIAALGITAEEAAALTAEQILAYRAQLAEQYEQPEVAPLTEEEIAALGITAEEAAALSADEINFFRAQMAPLTEEEIAFFGLTAEQAAALTMAEIYALRSGMAPITMMDFAGAAFAGMPAGFEALYNEMKGKVVDETFSINSVSGILSWDVQKGAAMLALPGYAKTPYVTMASEGINSPMYTQFENGGILVTITIPESSPLRLRASSTYNIVPKDPSDPLYNKQATYLWSATAANGSLNLPIYMQYDYDAPGARLPVGTEIPFTVSMDGDVYCGYTDMDGIRVSEEELTHISATANLNVEVSDETYRDCDWYLDQSAPVVTTSGTGDAAQVIVSYVVEAYMKNENGNKMLLDSDYESIKNLRIPAEWQTLTTNILPLTVTVPTQDGSAIKQILPVSATRQYASDAAVDVPATSPNNTYDLPMPLIASAGNMTTYTKYTVKLTYKASDFEIPFYQYAQNMALSGAIKSTMQIKQTGSSDTITTTTPTGTFTRPATRVAPVKVTFTKKVEYNGTNLGIWKAPMTTTYPSQAGVSIYLEDTATGLPAAWYTENVNTYTAAVQNQPVSTTTGMTAELCVMPGTYLVKEVGGITGFAQKNAETPVVLARTDTTRALDVINTNGGIQVNKLWVIDGAVASGITDSVEITLFKNATGPDKAQMYTAGSTNKVDAVLSTDGASSVTFSMDPGTYYVEETNGPSWSSKPAARIPVTLNTVGELVKVDLQNKVRIVRLNHVLQIADALSRDTFSDAKQALRDFSPASGKNMSTAFEVKIHNASGGVIAGPFYPHMVQSSGSTNPYIADDGIMSVYVPDSVYCDPNAASYSVTIAGNVPGYGNMRVVTEPITSDMKDRAKEVDTLILHLMGVVDISKYIQYDFGPEYEAQNKAERLSESMRQMLLGGSKTVEYKVEYANGSSVPELTNLTLQSAVDNARYVIDGAGVVSSGTIPLHAVPGSLRAIFGIPVWPETTNYRMVEQSISDFDYIKTVVITEQSVAPIKKETTIVTPDPVAFQMGADGVRVNLVKTEVYNRPVNFGAVLVRALINDNVSYNYADTNFQPTILNNPDFQPTFGITHVNGTATTQYPAKGLFMVNGQPAVMLYPVPLNTTVTVKEAGVLGTYTPVKGATDTANWNAARSTAETIMPAPSGSRNPVVVETFYNTRSQMQVTIEKYVQTVGSGTARPRTSTDGVFTVNLYRALGESETGTNVQTINIGGTNYRYDLGKAPIVYTFNGTLSSVTNNVAIPAPLVKSDYVAIESATNGYEPKDGKNAYVVTLEIGKANPPAIRFTNSEYGKIQLTTYQSYLAHDTSTTPHTTTAYDQNNKWIGNRNADQTVAATGTALQYKFTSLSGNNPVYTAWVTQSGDTSISLPSGNYRVELNTALPSGYQLIVGGSNVAALPFNMTVSAATVTSQAVRFYNPNGFLCFEKQDQAGAALDGAAFKLEKITGPTTRSLAVSSVTRINAGHFCQTNLPIGEYALVETSAPTTPKMYYADPAETLVTVGGLYNDAGTGMIVETSDPTVVANCYTTGGAATKLKIVNKPAITFNVHKGSLLNGGTQPNTSGVPMTIVVSDGAGGYKEYDVSKGVFGNESKYASNTRSTAANGIATWKLPPAEYYVFEQPSAGYIPAPMDLQPTPVTTRVKTNITKINGTTAAGWVLGPYALNTSAVTTAGTLSVDVLNMPERMDVDTMAYGNFHNVNTHSDALGSFTFELVRVMDGVHDAESVTAVSSVSTSVGQRISGQTSYWFKNVQLFYADGTPIKYEMRTTTAREGYMKTEPVSGSATQSKSTKTMYLADRTGKIYPATGTWAYTNANAGIKGVGGTNNAEIKDQYLPTNAQSAYEEIIPARLAVQPGRTADGYITLGVQNWRAGNIDVYTYYEACVNHGLIEALAGVRVGLFLPDGTQIDEKTSAGAMVTFNGDVPDDSEYHDYFLTAEANYYVAQMNKLPGYAIYSCTAQRAPFPAKPTVGDLSKTTEYNVFAIRSENFGVDKTRKEFIASATMMNHHPFIILDLRKLFIYHTKLEPEKLDGHGKPKAGVSYQEWGEGTPFKLFAFTLKEKEAAAGYDLVMEEISGQFGQPDPYLADTVDGIAGRILTTPLDYGKIYVFAEMGSQGVLSFYIPDEIRQQLKDEFPAWAFDLDRNNETKGEAYNGGAGGVDVDYLVPEDLGPGFRTRSMYRVKGDGNIAGDIKAMIAAATQKSFNGMVGTVYEDKQINTTVATVVDNKVGEPGGGPWNYHETRMKMKKQLYTLSSIIAYNGATFEFYLHNILEDGTVLGLDKDGNVITDSGEVSFIGMRTTGAQQRPDPDGTPEVDKDGQTVMWDHDDDPETPMVPKVRTITENGVLTTPTIDLYNWKMYLLQDNGQPYYFMLPKNAGINNGGRGAIGKDGFLEDNQTPGQFIYTAGNVVFNATHLDDRSQLFTSENDPAIAAVKALAPAGQQYEVVKAYLLPHSGQTPHSSANHGGTGTQCSCYDVMVPVSYKELKPTQLQILKGAVESELAVKPEPVWIHCGGHLKGTKDRDDSVLVDNPVKNIQSGSAWFRVRTIGFQPNNASATAWETLMTKFPASASPFNGNAGLAMNHRDGIFGRWMNGLNVNGDGLTLNAAPSIGIRPLAGVQYYAYYKDGNGTLVRIKDRWGINGSDTEAPLVLTTDYNGFIVSPPLPNDTEVFLVQMTAVDGYVNTHSADTFTAGATEISGNWLNSLNLIRLPKLQTGTVKEYYATNPEQMDLHLNAFDELTYKANGRQTAIKLKDVTFTLKDGGAVIKTGVTLESGLAVLTRMPVGTYSLEAALTADQQKDYFNYDAVQVHVGQDSIKLTTPTGQVLGGYSFALGSSSKYTVQRDVLMGASDDFVSLDVLFPIKPFVRLEKRDVFTGKVLANVRFDLYKGADKIATALSDENGIVVFLNTAQSGSPEYRLDAGNYTLRENTDSSPAARPQGLLYDANWKIDFTVAYNGVLTAPAVATDKIMQSRETTTFKVNNSRKISLTVHKQGTNGENVPSVVFDIKAPSGTTVPRTTAANGKTLTYSISEIGAYVITERREDAEDNKNFYKPAINTIWMNIPADGVPQFRYGSSTGTIIQNITPIPDNGVISWSGTTNETTHEYEMTLVWKNPTRYSLVFDKVNGEGTKLADAQFKLFSDAECRKEVDPATFEVHGSATATSTAAGLVSFTGLIPGKQYYLKETQQPTGYNPPSTPPIGFLFTETQLKGSSYVATLSGQTVVLKNKATDDNGLFYNYKDTGVTITKRIYWFKDEKGVVYNDSANLPSLNFVVYEESLEKGTPDTSHIFSTITLTLAATQPSTDYSVYTGSAGLAEGNYWLQEDGQATVYNSKAALQIDLDPSHGTLPEPANMLGFWPITVYKEGTEIGGVKMPPNVNLNISNVTQRARASLLKWDEDKVKKLGGAKYVVYFLKDTSIANTTETIDGVTYEIENPARYDTSNRYAFNDPEDGCAVITGQEDLNNNEISTSLNPDTLGQLYIDVALPRLMTEATLVFEEVLPPNNYVRDPRDLRVEVVVHSNQVAPTVEMRNYASGKVSYEDYYVSYRNGIPEYLHDAEADVVKDVKVRLFYGRGQDQILMPVDDMAPIGWNTATQGKFSERITTLVNGRLAQAVWNGLPANYHYAIQIEPIDYYTLEKVRDISKNDRTPVPPDLLPLKTRVNDPKDASLTELHLYHFNSVMNDRPDHTLTMVGYHNYDAQIEVVKFVDGTDPEKNIAEWPAKFKISYGKKDPLGNPIVDPDAPAINLAVKEGGNQTLVVNGEFTVTGRAKLNGLSIRDIVNGSIFIIEELVPPTRPGETASLYRLPEDPDIDVTLTWDPNNPQISIGLMKRINFYNYPYAENPNSIFKKSNKDELAGPLMTVDPAAGNVIDTVTYTLHDFMKLWNTKTSAWEDGQNDLPYESYRITDFGPKFSANANDFIADITPGGSQHAFAAADKLDFDEYVKNMYAITSIKIGAASYQMTAEEIAAAVGTADEGKTRKDVTAKVEYAVFDADSAETIAESEWKVAADNLSLATAQTLNANAFAAGEKVRAFRVSYNKPGKNFTPGNIDYTVDFYKQPDGFESDGETLRRAVRVMRNAAMVEASFFPMTGDGISTTIKDLPPIYAEDDVKVPDTRPIPTLQLLKRLVKLGTENIVETITDAENDLRAPVEVSKNRLMTYQVTLVNHNTGDPTTTGSMIDPMLIDRLPEDFALTTKTGPSGNVPDVKWSLVEGATQVEEHPYLTLENAAVHELSGPDMHTGDTPHAAKDTQNDSYLALYFKGELKPGQQIVLTITGMVPQSMPSNVDTIEYNDAYAGTPAAIPVHAGNPDGLPFYRYKTQTLKKETPYLPGDALFDKLTTVGSGMTTGRFATMVGMLESHSRYELKAVSETTATKSVRGDVSGSDEFVMDTVASSFTGGTVTYRLNVEFSDTFQNNPSFAMTNLRIVDILPWMGNDANRSVAGAKASTWQPALDKISVTVRDGNGDLLASPPLPTLRLVRQNSTNYSALRTLTGTSLKNGTALPTVAGDTFANPGNNQWDNLDANVTPSTVYAGFDLDFVNWAIPSYAQVTVEITCKVPSLVESVSDPLRQLTFAQAMNIYYTTANNNAYYNMQRGGKWSTTVDPVEINTVRSTIIPPPTERGDLIWLDINADGIQNNNEPGIQDVDVSLHSYEFRTSTGALMNHVVDPAQTGSAGNLNIATDGAYRWNYLFNNIVAFDGDFNTNVASQYKYKLSVNVPTGLRPVASFNATAGTKLDSNLVAVTAGEPGAITTSYWLRPNNAQDDDYIVATVENGKTSIDRSLDGGLGMLYDFSGLKKDDKGEPVKDVTITATPASGPAISAVTDEDGVYTLIGLNRFVSYTVSETDAPNGYIVDAHTYTLPGIDPAIAQRDNVTVADIQGWIGDATTEDTHAYKLAQLSDSDLDETTFYNTVGVGSLEIVKEAESLTRGESGPTHRRALGDVSFLVENVNTILADTYDSFIAALKAGVMPTGLHLVTLTESEDADSPYYGMEPDSLIATTAADGKVKIENLPWGEYTVREISAPDGYIIFDTTAQTVKIGDPKKLEPTSTYGLYVVDCVKRFIDPAISLMLHKVDASGANLEPAGFTILTDAQKQQVTDTMTAAQIKALGGFSIVTEPATSGANASWYLNDNSDPSTFIPWVVGETYWFFETDPPIGYQPVAPFSLTIAADKAVYIYGEDTTPLRGYQDFIVRNDAIIDYADLGTLTINKIDSTDSSPVGGAEVLIICEDDYNDGTWDNYLAKLDNDDVLHVIDGTEAAGTRYAKYAANVGALVVLIPDSGELTISLPWGTYSIQEIYAPDGYAIDDAALHQDAFYVGDPRVPAIALLPQDYKLDWTHEYSDTPLYLTIEKNDPAGNDLSGAIFEIYKAADVTDGVPNDGVSAYMTLTTDDNGKATSANEPNLLLEGDYVLIEKTAPAYHDNTYVPFEFSVNRTSTNALVYALDISNPITVGSITIEKRDVADEALLAGAHFEIRNVSTLVPGAWDKAMETYPTNSDLYKVTVGTETHLMLILPSAAAYTVDNLPLGDYTVTETNAPNGYAIAQDSKAVRNVTVAGDTEEERAEVLEPFYDQKALIIVEKTNAMAQPLVATFRVDVALASGETDSFTLTTSATTGKADTTGRLLMPGTYTITEITPPALHTNSGRTETFTINTDMIVHAFSFTAEPVSEDDVTNGVEINKPAFVNDYKRGELTVNKNRTRAALSEPTNGAIFTLTMKTELVEGAWDNYLEGLEDTPVAGLTPNMTTKVLTIEHIDAASVGTIKVAGLPWGTYDLLEIQAAPGTAIGDATARLVTIGSVEMDATTNADSKTETFNNPVIELHVQKTNPLGDKLEATFELQRKDTAGVYQTVTTLITNASTGMVVYPAAGSLTSDLIPGDYKLIETIAPENHDLSIRDDAELLFSIDGTKQIYVFSFTKEPILSADKAAFETRLGAFVNRFSSGTLYIESYKTSDAIPGTPQEALFGDTVYEIRCTALAVGDPSASENPWTQFLMSLDQTTLDAIGGEVDGDILRITMPASGKVTIAGMPYGSYVLEEVKAAPGTAVGVLPRPFSFSKPTTTEPDADEETLQLYNPIIRVAIEKTNPMEHPLVAGFTITKAEDSTFSKELFTAITSDDVGLVVYPLDLEQFFTPGTYTITETTAPDDHDLSTALTRTFTVTDTGLVYVHSYTKNPQLTVVPNEFDYVGSVYSDVKFFEERGNRYVNDFARGKINLNKFQIWVDGRRALVNGAKFVLTADPFITYPGMNSSWEYMLNEIAGAPEKYPGVVITQGNTLELTVDNAADVGKLSVLDLPWGNYTITEIVAPVNTAIGAATQSYTFCLTDVNVTHEGHNHAKPEPDQAKEKTLSFDNPTIQIEVEKTNALAMPLVATFELRNSTGTKLAITGLTDANKQFKTSATTGKASFEASDVVGGLPVGTYSIVEVASPRYHELDVQPTKTFTITNNQTQQLISFVNRAQADVDPALETNAPAFLNDYKRGALALSKAAIYGTQRRTAEDATFELVNNSTFVTAASGENAWDLFLAELGAGTSTLPAGATLSGEKILIDMSGLANATITLSRLPWGNYTLTETRASTGTAIGFAPQTFVIGNATETATPAAVVEKVINATNPVISVVIAKTNSAGDKLAGAQFTIRHKGGADVATGLTTDANGTVTFPALTDTTDKWSLLTPGTYEIVETLAPAGHELTDPAIKEFTITDTQVNDLISFTLTALRTGANSREDRHDAFVNPYKRGAIILNKQDKAEPTTLLAGAVFEIGMKMTNGQNSLIAPSAWNAYLTELAAKKPANIQIVGNMTNTANKLRNDVVIRVTIPAGGTYKIENLPLGTYLVKEIASPNGFAIDDLNAHNVTVPDGATLEQRIVTENFTDTRLVIKLTKYSEDRINKLAGAEFDILDNTGKVVFRLQPTDANGYTDSTLLDRVSGEKMTLKPGTYTLHESKAADYYSASFKDVTFVVTNTQKAYVYDFTGKGRKAPEDAMWYNQLVTNDLLKGNVTFNMRNSQTMALQGGSVYEIIIDHEFATGSWDYFVKTMKTQFKGTEPTGYRSQYANAVIAETTVGGKRAITIRLPNMGANNGTISFQIPWGAYTIQCVKPAVGHVRDQVDVLHMAVGHPAHPVIISHAAANPHRPADSFKESHAFDYTETPITVEIQKINNLDRFVSGVTFSLRNANDPGFGTIYGTTGTNGTLTFKPLMTPGTYTLTETNAGPYHSGDFTTTFVVAKDDNNFKTFYDFTNRVLSADQKNMAAVDEAAIVNQINTGTLRVIKRDSTTGTPLAGAEFTVRQVNMAGSALAWDEESETTDADGVAEFSGLPMGTYQVWESAAPRGYTLLDTVRTITLEADATVTTTFNDGRMYGALRVYKIDGNNGLPLAGATFNLTGESGFGDVIDMTGTTDASGYVYFNNLPYGTYTLSETIAPDARYSLAADRTITIGRTETITATVRNFEIGALGVLGVVDEAMEGVLPVTGEDLPIGLYAGMGTLCAAMGLLLLIARRKRQGVGKSK